MKIYTKTGDKGQTSLIGGTRVPKNSVRLEAYGGVDELNSYLGWVRSFPILPELKEELAVIQNILFSVAGNLATDTSVKNLKVKLGVTEEDVAFLERAIDRMNEQLPPLTSFILPGGNQPSSVAHVARTVCRRVERRVLDVAAQYEVDELIIRYVNRLSDYLFVLARKIASDMGAEELTWKMSVK
ncbi:cob(I)yrinic acid a,c-diamide adenosyltransferase [Odoribacter lunatus]|uniref:cob(I)yrinic acid a,c-diamide adenosyltransferase n=1 Tax=Odoribacter lunatus TaxID=2941335 RepID=UPI00203B6629|nr:cob(I)yrinic acid a,c-diamide adenosyltransferase [Odoribacter lunatus]